ncbi:hypothetical protein [Stutzerimonas stutzeri]|uniref:hypothetical protein n=1 Tax=Stutzerimonas stutzeri TaxID=316 RepID=UPI002659D9B4|nr:hypothetical protein [Stutzerimonas stutzeri]MCF6780911.1 hypothetical protein [Stutzerimonas stutzeri]MCF6803480.1 hypothetical protein [Stutzerimonas stutzeri]
MSTPNTDDKPKATRRTTAKPDDEPKSEKPVAQASNEIEIWPLRSYQDVGEIKRRGGPSYTAPKRHADALIARGLASAEKPKNTK